MSPCLRLEILVALTSVAFLSGMAQRSPVSDAGTVSSGTLNLVLANKNGFVIAADSRRSNPTNSFDCGGAQQHYCDDSQKLFRTGKESAMVIAGFAVGRKGTPLDLAVASILRKRFSPGGNRVLQQDTGTGKFSFRDASEVGFEGVAMDSSWTASGLEPALTGVASIYDPVSLPPSQMLFSAIFAGIEKDEKIVLRQQVFEGSWRSSGQQTGPIPHYEVRTSPILTVQTFFRGTAGITCVADAILGGYYKSSDPVITKYYAKLHDQSALDSMSLAEMADLTRVLLRETAKFTDFVGGPDEIGIFPAKGEPQWVAAAMPTEQALTPRFFVNECLSYTKNTRATQGPCARGTFEEDFQRPLEEVIAQFFLACQFNGVSVALDDNYLVRSRFEGVTFKYAGHPFLALNNTYISCRVEFPEGVTLPNGSEIFDHCEKVKVKSVTLDSDTIGKPLKWEKDGTRIRLPIP